MPSARWAYGHVLVERLTSLLFWHAKKGNVSSSSRHENGRRGPWVAHLDLSC